jgi:hypothetical protein
LGEFLAFVLIIFTFGWATAFLIPYVRRHWQKLDQTADQEVLARLLEDMDQISSRLSHIEEDLEFYRELRGPEDPDRLPAPAEDGEGG